MNRPYTLALGAAFLLLSAAPVHAQLTVSAPDSSGGAYGVFAGAGGGKGLGVEGPDSSSRACVLGDPGDAGNHADFGDHIVQVADAELGDAFEFVSHIDEDSDRCENFDRVRIEVKGGPQGDSDPRAEHAYGEESVYRWRFRLDAGFVGTTSFTHLFQNKAEGGDSSGQPILTLTAKVERMELIYAPLDDGATDTVLAAAPLDDFRGEWVEVYLRQVHADAGQLELLVSDVSSGRGILQYADNDIDLWRESPTSGTINRPKWGIYRRKREGFGQRDERVRFADFELSETMVSATSAPRRLGLRLSPNPVQASLRIEGLTGSPAGYRIFSLDGREVVRGMLQRGGATVAVDALPRGVYFVRVASGSGEFAVGRFVRG